ncbi:MAG TPA: hypothetical protein VFS16_16515 [Acidimicrobiia bacterium]|nr:hypothetical protein [Acidimicrobiia bacterium]
MKRFIGLFVATIAVIAPVSAAGAATVTVPAEYNPSCEQAYQGGKALFDALIASPLKAALNPLEKGLCGENKYAA